MDEHRRKLALMRGIRLTIQALDQPADPRTPSEPLPPQGVRRVSALQGALEALLWAVEVCPPGVIRWAVCGVCIEAVRLSAWIVWHKPKEKP